MGEFSGGCTAADGCREQPLLAVILQEGMVLRKDKVEISAVPLQVEQAQLDTWIDIGRLIVEIGKTL